MTFFRVFAVCLLSVLTLAAPLRAEDIPPRLPAADFAKLPLYRGAQLSPDGKYLAYIMPVKGRNNVIIQQAQAKGAKPAMVPPIRKFDIDWIRWANDTRLLIAYSKTVKSKGTAWTETRLLAVDAEGGKMINVVKPDRDLSAEHEFVAQIQTRIVDMLPDDPKHILLALDPTRDGSYAVMKVNIYSRRQTRVQGGKREVQHWLADQQGVPRLGRGYWQGDSKFKIQYRDPESRKWLKLQNTDWYEEGFSLQAFMADPGFAYAIGPVDGRQTLVRLNVREGQVEEVLFAHETLDIDGLERDGAGRKVIGVTYTEHFTRVHYLAARMRKLQATIDRLLPDTANRITQTLAGGKMFLIRVRSGHRPDEYHILDLNSKQLYLLVRTRPQLDPANMARMEAVTYQARDGMEIPAYITWPKGRGRKNLPAIILPHGGPQSRTTMDFNYLTQFLANRGYLVLQPNFRGSTGYGAAFQAAGEKQWGGLMQDDVTDGTRWLISEGLADPARICIVGASYGGYVALMGAIKTPDLFQCAASINGVADIPGLVAHYKKFIGGSAWIKDLTQDEDGRKAISPQHRAREIKIPVFLAAAKDDETVPYAQSRALYARLKTRVPAVYVQLKRGGNDLDHQDGRQKVLEALDTFLAKHLPVHE